MAASDNENSSPLFPLFLDLAGVPVLVVGAGTVAERRVKALLGAGARVRVVAPDAGSLAARVVSGSGTLSVAARRFAPSDLEGVRLAFAATNASEVNAEIARLGHERGIFVNVAEAARLSTAHVPATLTRGTHLAVAVSTRGGSPRLGRLLKESLEPHVSEAWGEVATVLAELRLWWEPRAREAGLLQPERQQVWESLVTRALVERCLLAGPRALRSELEALLTKAVGPGECSL